MFPMTAPSRHPKPEILNLGPHPASKTATTRTSRQICPQGLSMSGPRMENIRCDWFCRPTSQLEFPAQNLSGTSRSAIAGRTQPRWRFSPRNEAQYGNCSTRFRRIAFLVRVKPRQPSLGRLAFVISGLPQCASCRLIPRPG